MSAVMVIICAMSMLCVLILMVVTSVGALEVLLEMAGRVETKMSATLVTLIVMQTRCVLTQLELTNVLVLMVIKRMKMQLVKILMNAKITPIGVTQMLFAQTRKAHIFVAANVAMLEMEQHVKMLMNVVEPV
jgi:hypothetical protein